MISHEIFDLNRKSIADVRAELAYIRKNMFLSGIDQRFVQILERLVAIVETLNEGDFSDAED